MLFNMTIDCRVEQHLFLVQINGKNEISTLKNRILILYIKLVSESFVAIPTMDDTAVLEACLKDGVLHHEIVAMGVYADGTVVLQSVLQHLPEDAFDLSAAGYAVDGGIGGIVQPGSVVDDIVGRVYTAPQDEGGHDMIVLDADIAVATLDVLP